MPEPILLLDPIEASNASERARVRAQTRIYPAMRGAGFQALVLLMLVHNRFVLGEVNYAALVRYMILADVYCLASWLLLNRYYTRFSFNKWDLSELFFATDLILWTLAIYLTGAQQSLLFFILMLRVADHVYMGSRVAFGYAHAILVFYIAMLVWVHFIDGETFALLPQVAKMLFLYVSGLYLAFTSTPAERMRARTSQAVHYARDLIRQLDAEKQRAEDAHRAAVKANEFKSVLLSRVSHEFRTPLNHILGFAQILQMDELSRAQRESVDQIEDGGRRLLALVDEVLDISAAEAGAIELRLAPVALSDAVEEALESVRTLAAQKDIVLRTNGIYEVPRVRADRARLQQVLTGLILNAVEYNSVGGEVHIIAESLPEPARVRISVRDTGPGIAPEQLENLFLPFERLTGEENTGAGGRGLGLVLGKALIESMRGTIAVRSQPGFGSTFVVELPAA